MSEALLWLFTINLGGLLSRVGRASTNFATLRRSSRGLPLSA